MELREDDRREGHEGQSAGEDGEDDGDEIGNVDRRARPRSRPASALCRGAVRTVLGPAEAASWKPYGRRAAARPTVYQRPAGRC